MFIREKDQETVCRSKPGKGLLDCRRTLAVPDGGRLETPKWGIKKIRKIGKIKNIKKLK